MDHRLLKQELLRLLGAVRLSRKAPSRRCSWDRHGDSSGVIAGRPAAAGRTGEAADNGLLLPIHERDHTRGSDSAPVTVVEYGDYQCPQCGEAYLAIKELRKIVGDRIRFVFRQYPYARLHPQAMLAAEAAEAAAAQGRFWEMHDLLFQHQDALTDSRLLEYAKTLNMDLGRFCWELKNRVHRERVREDFRSGVVNGVYSTPALFINGVRHNGAFDLETILDTVSLMLQKMDRMKETSVQPLCRTGF